MSLHDDDDFRTAADLIDTLELARAGWLRSLQEGQTPGGSGWDSLREKFHEWTRLSRRLCNVLRCEGCLHHEGRCYSLDAHERLTRRAYKTAKSVLLKVDLEPDPNGEVLTAAVEAEDRSC